LLKSIKIPKAGELDFPTLGLDSAAMIFFKNQKNDGKKIE
jgi:hypothetical protein